MPLNRTALLNRNPTLDQWIARVDEGHDATALWRALPWRTQRKAAAAIGRALASDDHSVRNVAHRLALAAGLYSPNRTDNDNGQIE